jgi:hypothetical protein
LPSYFFMANVLLWWFLIVPTNWSEPISVKFIL